MVDFILTNADGSVYSSKAVRGAKKQSLANLTQRHLPTNPALAAMLESFHAAMKDPEDEVLHLYQIRDSLKAVFFKDAQELLKIPKDDWSRFGAL